jgi:hypothetical protein
LSFGAAVPRAGARSIGPGDIPVLSRVRLAARLGSRRAQPQAPHRARTGADRDVTTISRLVLRRDGFVSAQTGQKLGEFTTPPLKFIGRRLRLNIDTSAVGIARVACVDVEGKPITGYSLEDCDIIHTANEINRAVTWRGSPELPATVGVMRLRVEMRNTDLYALPFSTE